MILHIPHSATYIPEDATYLCDLQPEIEHMTDWYTDDLYEHPDAKRIVFAYSRLYCDVERFSDDAQESMSKVGMGVCYTHNSQGERLRDVSNELKEKILTECYRPHHNQLTKAVENELREKGSALIVDCHSFPDEVMSYHANDKRPDFCIGTDSLHTPKALTVMIKDYLVSKGYSVLENEPYCGTMVPMQHYHKDNRVGSVMIEINRKLYCDAQGIKLEGYAEIKETVRRLLEIIKTFEDSLRSMCI